MDAPTSNPKPLEKDVPDSVIVQKTVNVKNMLGKGLGGTIGGPIFVILGIAIFQARSGILISIAINGIMMLFFILIYSELALSLPMTGGGYTFSKEAIGGGYGFLLGWLMWWGNIAFAALSAIGFGLSLQLFVPDRYISPQLYAFIVGAVIVFFYFYNLKYPNSLGKFLNFSAYWLVISFVTFIIVGIALTGFNRIPNPEVQDIFAEPFNFSGVLSMTAFTFAIFCIYEWNSSFEQLTAEFDKIKRPRKNLPRTFLISIGIGIFIYWGVTLVTLMIIGSTSSEAWTIVTQSSTPLADAFGIILGPFGIIFMGFAGVVATITSINAGIQMSTNIIGAMSRDGYMHTVVQRERSGVRYVALTLSCGLIFVFAMVSDLELITHLTNFIFLVSMGFLSVSVILLRHSRKELHRPWKVPGYPYVPIISAIACVIFVFSIPGDAVLYGIIILLTGIIYYLVGISRRDRVLLVVQGSKIGMVVLLLFFCEITHLNTTPVINVRILLRVLTVIVFLSLVFDLSPIRVWLSKYGRKEKDINVVGGINVLSSTQETFARHWNYTVAGILIGFGLLFGLLTGLLYLGLLILAAPNIVVEVDSLHKLGIVLFALASMVFTLNGMLITLQELEIRNLSRETPSKT